MKIDCAPLRTFIDLGKSNQTRFAVFFWPSKLNPDAIDIYARMKASCDKLGAMDFYDAYAPRTHSTKLVDMGDAFAACLKSSYGYSLTGSGIDKSRIVFDHRRRSVRIESSREACGESLAEAQEACLAVTIQPKPH
jgi:hypothetical protein